MGVARFDLHVHGAKSPDAKGTIGQLAARAAKRGLDGFAITDHDHVHSDAVCEAAGQAAGVLVIPGCEVSTADGHLIALGVTSPVPRGASIKQTLRAVEDQGGIGYPSHPLKFGSGVGERMLQELAEDGLRLAEGRNGRQRRNMQARTEILLGRLGLAATGGTDAHWIKDLGKAWTVFEGPIRTVDDVLSRLREGACAPGGSSLRRPRVLMHSATVPFRNGLSRFRR